MTRGIARLKIPLAVSTVLSSATVLAQQVPQGTDGLEEIVVTAQKRAQRLQDVPLAVSAISGDEMDRKGAQDIHDILLSVPGLSYSSTEPGQSRYSIRGVSTAASNPTVGIYLDDISLVSLTTAFSGAADPVLFDLDRVEVLKGPQGTLYGGSAMGGAIKYVNRQPSFNQLSVTAEGGVATTDQGGISYNGNSVLNLPLVSDKLAMRLGVSYRYDAGYINYVPDAPLQDWARSAAPSGEPFAPEMYSSLSNLYRSDANSRSTTAVRLALKYAVDDSLSILPAVSIQRGNKANPDWFYTNLPGLQGSFRTNQPTRDNLGVYSLTVTKSFAGLTLTSLSGYVDRTVEWDRDYSLFIGGLVPGLFHDNSYNISNTGAHTFSQEVRLSSDTAGPLKWVVGAYYSQQRYELFQRADTAGAGVYLGTGTDTTYVGDQLTRISQEDLFGDVTYSLNAHWDLSAGLRWFDIRQKIDGVFDGFFNGGASVIDGNRSTDVGVTPKYSVNYRPLDGRLLYATVSKGFREGGPNQFNTDSPLCDPDFQKLGISRAPASYQSDSLWTYELGTKNELKELHTVVDAAVYYTDWKKIQQQVNLNSCGFNFVGNLGAATIKGAELSVESALGGGVSAGVTGSYLDTRITESAPGVSAQVGQPTLDTPKWMVSAYGDYKFSLIAGWTGSLRPEYQFRGANLRQFDSLASITYPDGSRGTTPDQTQWQHQYHTVNALLNIAHDAWEYRVYVNNITNAQPYLDFNRASGLSEATTIRPRTVGVSVKTTF
jgi:outer membrane receptor protein involved in Fe transport